MAANGPTLGIPHNINGAKLIGEIHSYTTDDYIYTYVGTGDASSTSSGPIEPEIERSKISRTIMDHITGRKLHRENQ